MWSEERAWRRGRGCWPGGAVGAVRGWMVHDDVLPPRRRKEGRKKPFIAPWREGGRSLLHLQPQELMSVHSWPSIGPGTLGGHSWPFMPRMTSPYALPSALMPRPAPSVPRGTQLLPLEGGHSCPLVPSGEDPCGPKPFHLISPFQSILPSSCPSSEGDGRNGQLGGELSGWLG